MNDGQGLCRRVLSFDEMQPGRFYHGGVVSMASVMVLVSCVMCYARN